MRVVDSRRLTGPSLLLDRPGVVLDVALDGADGAGAAERWSAESRRLLDALGWGDEHTAARVFPGGLSLAFTAPIDALYAATEVNEAAWNAAEAGGASDLETTRGRLREVIAKERNPRLIALAEAAARRGISFLSDDKRVSVGLGVGSRSWPIASIPLNAERLRWHNYHDVPLALVTGTNGKTTTVRLLAAMARAAGKVPGMTSTDRVEVGGEVVAEGDFSGPNGARTVLRDRRVEIGLLETARGGLLRRGLAVRRAQAALVTNIAADHIGEFGVTDLGALADTKLVVAKAVGHEGRVVLNADDPLLLARGLRLERPITWFSLDPTRVEVARHIEAGGDACRLEADTLALWRRGHRDTVISVRDVPIAMGGAARHNLSNALGAIGVAAALDLPVEAMAEGLRGFANSPSQNPGRGNLIDVGGVHVLVDYAHNPHGMASLVDVVQALPASRRLVVLGQAGDRDDEAIRDLVREALRMRPDRVVIKEMRVYLRGRPEGEIPRLLEAELRSQGVASDAISHAGSEIEALRAALAWARESDVLVVPTHAEREAVLGTLDKLRERGWRPGKDLGE